MHLIKLASIKDATLLSKLSKQTFLTSHGHSAPKEVIENFISKNFSVKRYITELENTENIFSLIYYKEKIAGYSKIIFDNKCKDVNTTNVTYLSRIYLLEEFYGLGLGKKLLDFNISFCKKNNQSGIWLYVWKENNKAISFYNKNDFKIVGNYDYRLSENHTNPNHVLFLKI